MESGESQTPYLHVMYDLLKQAAGITPQDEKLMIFMVEDTEEEIEDETLPLPWEYDDQIPTLVIDEDEVDFSETFNNGNYEVFEYYSDLLDQFGVAYDDEIFDVPMEAILYWEPAGDRLIEISIDLDTLQQQIKQFS